MKKSKITLQAICTLVPYMKTLAVLHKLAIKLEMKGRELPINGRMYP